MRVKDMKITQFLTVEKLIKIAETANKFESDIHIVGKNFKVDAKSLMGLLATLRHETDVTIMTKGEDEEEAIKEFSKLLL
ncbi:HPr family phosphocarrier protein [uncultured Metabacillus sp.]|uniref:HPr family phosphocarrier protein n=1 Tax=Metabacillus sp. Hm71 TaxID=3450743 RepID=UPI002616BED4|nr:HPr family phosphocarrier protein [uncultured Metabacillus sp.]